MCDLSLHGVLRVFQKGGEGEGRGGKGKGEGLFTYFVYFCKVEEGERGDG